MKIENDNLLTSDQVILLVIDIQEKLLPKIYKSEQVKRNVSKLLKFVNIMNLPTILLEQENLGKTVPDIKKLIPNLDPIRKITFNSFSNEVFVNHLHNFNGDTLTLTGIETHICVAQTALSALGSYRVQVLRDAVSSQRVQDKEAAIERIKSTGGIISSMEMFLFEILKRAGTDEFKKVLPIIKS